MRWIGPDGPPATVRMTPLAPELVPPEQSAIPAAATVTAATSVAIERHRECVFITSGLRFLVQPAGSPVSIACERELRGYVGRALGEREWTAGVEAAAVRRVDQARRRTEPARRHRGERAAGVGRGRAQQLGVGVRGAPADD